MLTLNHHGFEDAVVGRQGKGVGVEDMLQQFGQGYARDLSLEHAVEVVLVGDPLLQHVLQGTAPRGVGQRGQKGDDLAQLVVDEDGVDGDETHEHRQSLGLLHFGEDG